MTSLRTMLGIRNTHGYRRNLLYFLYHRFVQVKSQVRFSPQDEDAARRLKASGIATLGVANVDELARIVEDKLATVPVVDGYAQLPRQYNPLLVPHLFRVLQEKGGAIQAYYRSHFRVNWFEAQKIAPGQQSSGSSFAFHTDDTPLPIIKLFIYLTNTRDATGAFRAFSYPRTDALIRSGMLESAFPGERRAKAQELIPPDYEKELSIVEGPKGTVFIFDNNLIHKGTLPQEGMRIHVSMEIMPSDRPQTEAELMHNCDKGIQEYFPVNPFRRKAHIEAA